MAQSSHNLVGKYKRSIMLQDDYRNYFSSAVTMKNFAKSYNISVSRLGIIFSSIHIEFGHFLNTPKYKHLHPFLFHTVFKTKKLFVDQTEKLTEFLQAFDVFAANNITEADKLH